MADEAPPRPKVVGLDGKALPQPPSETSKSIVDMADNVHERCHKAKVVGLAMAVLMKGEDGKTATVRMIAVDEGYHVEMLGGVTYLQYCLAKHINDEG